MYRKLVVPLVVLAAACSGGELPTAPAGPPGAPMFAAAAADHASAREALAASAHPEGKVLLSRFLTASGGRGLRDLAAASGQVVLPTAELQAAETIELYLPVPAHRAAWRGGREVLVGTIGADTEAPVAF